MTPELIKQWAKEADCMAVNLYGERPAAIERMMRFAALVAAHQRELDARICESEDLLWVDGKPTADAFAAAIRGRGE